MALEVLVRDFLLAGPIPAWITGYGRENKRIGAVFGAQPEPIRLFVLYPKISIYSRPAQFSNCVAHKNLHDFGIPYHMTRRA